MVSSPLLVVLIACIPGIAGWWTGRRLTRLSGDPMLPELLMARQQRLAGVVAVALAVLLVVGGTHALWGIPLLAGLALVGRYPLRRALLGETAGLVRSVWCGAKSLVGGLGFWALLAYTPTILVALDARWWPVPLALVSLLALWEHAYSGIWLRLHGAESLAGSQLEPRFQTIAGRAGIATPAVYRIGFAGMRLVNAVALPSIRRPAIGLGNELLELLDPDEVAAIYAHELSHIEQFSPRILQRIAPVSGGATPARRG